MTAQDLHYRVVAPHPLLVPYVGCYWVLKSARDRPPRRELILPDGYAELIFNLGNSYTWENQARQLSQRIRTIHLVGERDSSILVNLPGGIDQIGVKFKPMGLFALLHQPLSAIANQLIHVTNLEDTSLNELGEQVFDAPTDGARLELINRFFLQRLLVAEPPEPLVEQALQTILHRQGNVRVDELSQQLGTHYKALERKFKIYVGLTPKTFARVVRFKHTYKQFHAIAPHDPSFFLDLGYYDQNHFIKDFKYFLNTTPTAYRRKSSAISDEIVRRGLAAGTPRSSA
jgi:AraC-like DNA-binding protein